MKIKLTAAILLLIIIAAGAFITPGMIKNKLVSSLSEVIEEKSKIDRLKFSFLSGEVEILGLEIGKKEKLLSLKRVSIRPSYSSLLSDEIIINSLVIEGLVINTPPKLKKTQAKALSSESKPKKESQVLFKEIELTDIQINKTLLPLKENLLLKRAKFVDVGVQGDKFRGKIKDSETNIGASKVDLKAEFIKSETLNLKAELVATNFDLGHIEINKFDEKIKSLAGKLKLNLKLDYKDGAVKTNFTSHIGGFGYFPMEGASYSAGTFILSPEIEISSKKLQIKKTSLLLVDLIQKAPKETNKRIKKLEISNINFSKVEKDVKLSLEINKNGKVNFTNKKSVFTGTIKNLDLKKFSNFLVLDEESQVGSGKLFLNLNGKVTQNQELKGDLKLYIAQMNIEKSGDKDISLISTSRAVSLIKDKNGKIEIESKLSGSLDDPSFNILYFLSKGIGNVLAEKFYSLLAVEAAKKVAPLLLSSIPINPLNAISIFKKGYDLAVKPRFAGMNFEPHAKELKDRELEVLDRVLNFLKKEKEISLSFCVVTHLNEGQSKLNLSEAKKLRAKRSEAIVSYITKKTPRVEPQVVFCSDKSEIGDSGIGSLEVEL